MHIGTTWCWVSTSPAQASPLIPHPSPFKTISNEAQSLRWCVELAHRAVLLNSVFNGPMLVADNQPPSGVSTMATGKYYKSHASPPLSPKSWCTSILLPVVLTAPHRVPAGSQVSSSLACAFLPSTILGSPSCPHPACGLPPCRV